LRLDYWPSSSSGISTCFTDLVEAARRREEADAAQFGVDQFHRASNAVSMAASLGNTQRSNTTQQEQTTSRR
jgi:hypothetical protein